MSSNKTNILQDVIIAHYNTALLNLFPSNQRQRRRMLLYKVWLKGIIVFMMMVLIPTFPTFAEEESLVLDNNPWANNYNPLQYGYDNSVKSYRVVENFANDATASESRFGNDIFGWDRWTEGVICHVTILST